MLRVRAIRSAAPVLVLGLLGAALLTGCTTPTACPAIGWSNSLVVQVDPAISPVGEVQICVDDACISSVDRSGSASAAPSSTSPLSGAAFQAKDGQKWTFSLSMTNPKKVTVRVLNADSAVLRSVEASPEWQQVGGSEQCGGPAQATVAVS